MFFERTIFALAVILMPIVRNYGPKIGGTFSDLLILMLFIVLLIHQEGKISKKNTIFYFLPFLVYIFFVGLINGDSTVSLIDRLIDWVRPVMYYYVIVFGTKKYFDASKTYKIYEFATLASTLFLIIQYFSVIFGENYISGFWGSYSLIDSDEMFRKFSMFSIDTYRPNSFFREPAHYATYVTIFLCLHTMKKLNIKNIFITAFIMFGILLSGSTTGFVIAGIIMGYWLFKYFKEGNKLRYFFIIVILALFVFQHLYQLDSFRFMLYRTFKTDMASLSRFSWLKKGNITSILPLGTFNKLFGQGNVLLSNNWYPGWVLILRSYGIIGTLIYVICSIVTFVNSDSNARFLLIIFWILGLGTEVIADQHLMIVLCFVFSNFAFINYKKESRYIYE